MPDIIIEQSKEVINYINMLNLPISRAWRTIWLIWFHNNHRGNKNISNVYSRLTCNQNHSSGSRFLGEYKWVTNT